MAFPISSVTVSHKLSTNFSLWASTLEHNCLPTHILFRLNRMRSGGTARSSQLKIRCTSLKNSPLEFTDWHDTPPISYMSILGHTVKKLERIFAMILIFVQISSPLPLVSWDFQSISPAKAVLYSPDTKVPRTGELALRKAIPANANMKAIQDSLEEISYLLRIPQRKPYGTMEGNVKKALKIAVDDKESIIASLPTDLKEKGSLLYASLIDGKGGLQALLECIKDKDPDKVSVGLASSLDSIAELELLQAPGLSFLLPKQYLKYPRLTGRGTVEFTIEKGDGSTFSPEAGGEPRKIATVQVVVDGYSAPLTAGNFSKLVIDGAYNGAKLNCTDQAVLSDKGIDKNSGYNVPLEIMPSGQFEPLYRTALNVQDGELPVLPLSVYGAVAMAHSEVSEEYSSPYQFFFYLYDKRNAGLGGLSFEEGQFSVLGYTTLGKDILSQIKTGDIIRSAKLVEGQDRLGWTIYEILRYAPQHNWIAYEEALKTNPVLAKMVISGVVYSLGDWIAQCYEGKPLFEFDRTRMFRSGLVGFTLHGSLSHYYYQFCEELFPFQDWWVVPVKVVFDQTVWAATWNSIYYTVLGLLRFESPVSIFTELKTTFWPMLTAGWKLWPFAHLITYGVVPVEQRLLWVDCVELIWVTILSTLSNEKSEARISDAPAEADSSSPSIGPPESK